MKGSVSNRPVVLETVGLYSHSKWTKQMHGNPTRVPLDCPSIMQTVSNLSMLHFKLMTARLGTHQKKV